MVRGLILEFEKEKQITPGKSKQGRCKTFHGPKHLAFVHGLLGFLDQTSYRNKAPVHISTSSLNSVSPPGPLHHLSVIRYYLHKKGQERSQSRHVRHVLIYIFIGQENGNLVFLCTCQIIIYMPTHINFWYL